MKPRPKIKPQPVPNIAFVGDDKANHLPLPMPDDKSFFTQGGTFKGSLKSDDNWMKLPNKVAKMKKRPTIKCRMIKPHWSDGLSIRVHNILINNGINSKSQIKEFIESNMIYKARGCGFVARREICKWAGIPELPKNPQNYGLF